MRSSYLVLAGAVFAGGLLAAADAQEGRPFDALRTALNGLTNRVVALERETPAISQLGSDVASLSSRVSALEQQNSGAMKIVDALGQPIGRATFTGSTTYAVAIVDGVAAGFQVGDAGFRPAVAPTVWFQSTDCSGDAFLTTDTGIIRQGFVVGSAGVFAKGQFRPVQFKSRRAYPSGPCAGLTFTTSGAELGTVDLSGYHGPFSLVE